jgi:hypothetical protein
VAALERLEQAARRLLLQDALEIVLNLHTRETDTNQAS